MKRQKGFTLVELLVVIGIIALLISMLLPALNRVREHSKTVHCQGQLRQIMLAYTMYLADNHFYFMPGGYAGEPVEQKLFAGKLSRYMGKKYAAGQQPFQIWICPADPGRGGLEYLDSPLMPPVDLTSGGANFREFPRSYGQNRYTTTRGSNGALTFRITHVKRSAEFLVFGDFKSWLQWPVRLLHEHLEPLHSVAQYYEKWGDFHPKNTMNCAFLDGHVENIPKKHLLPLQPSAGLMVQGQRRNAWYMDNVARSTSPPE